MKRIKLSILAALAVGVMILGTACSSKDSQPQATTSVIESTVAITTEAATVEIKDSSSTDEKQMQGALEENKGFMFIIKADDDGEFYTFDVSDENLIKGINPGDKITVTYTGEDPKPADITDTVVIKVEKTK